MRFTSNKSRLVSTFVAAVFISVALLPGCEASSQSVEACRALAAIAGDAQKMRYVKERIAFKLRDRNFLDTLRNTRSFDWGNDRIREFDDLDWKYLGLNEESAAIEFNLPLDKAGDWDVDRIGSVSILQSRQFIVIRLNSGGSLGLSLTPEALAKLKAVNDDVFVYCGG